MPNDSSARRWKVAFALQSAVLVFVAMLAMAQGMQRHAAAFVADSCRRTLEHPQLCAQREAWLLALLRLLVDRISLADVEALALRESAGPDGFPVPGPGSSASFSRDEIRLNGIVFRFDDEGRLLSVTGPGAQR